MYHGRLCFSAHGIRAELKVLAGLSVCLEALGKNWLANSLFLDEFRSL